MKGTMRGICKSKPGVGAEYREDLPIPQITEDEVLIKVHATAICAGLKAVRKGGMFVSVGLPDGEVAINLTEDIIYREIIYTGVSGRLMFDTWEDCMKILQTPGFSLEPVIGGIYPLHAFEQALEDMKKGAPGKMILIP